MSKQKGFSLIELMIVITMIGILSVIAIPSYQKYTKRARFSEVVAATAPFQTAVSLALQEGQPKKDLANGTYGIPLSPEATRNLASVKVAAGIITAQATQLADGATYVLTPNDDGSRWAVTGTCLETALCQA